MKQQINEIKRMQLLAGVITESEYRESLGEELELDFEEKAKAFVNKHKNIIKDAVRFYKKRPDDYEESLMQTIYDFFGKELGEDWTTQISAPNPEDEKNYTYGWTDEKDEVFYNILKSILKTGSSLNEAENGDMITQNEIESLASSLDTELKFSPETLKGRFVDLGINFILSPDQNQLILNVTPSTGYDDPQEFIDDIESEIGFPDYDFSVKGSKVYITKK